MCVEVRILDVVLRLGVVAQERGHPELQLCRVGLDDVVIVFVSREQGLEDAGHVLELHAVLILEQLKKERQPGR